MQPVDPGMNTPPPDTPATELVKEVFTEAKELIRLEVALAKDEAKHRRRLETDVETVKERMI